MANNFGVVNPYTTKIPTGTINRVQLLQPSNVQIQIPNVTGGNKQPKTVGNVGGLFNALKRGL